MYQSMVTLNDVIKLFPEIKVKEKSETILPSMWHVIQPVNGCHLKNGLLTQMSLFLFSPNSGTTNSYSSLQKAQ